MLSSLPIPILGCLPVLTSYLTLLLNDLLTSPPAYSITLHYAIHHYRSFLHVHHLCRRRFHPF
jgi:hypothetical protein